MEQNLQNQSLTRNPQEVKASAEAALDHITQAAQTLFLLKGNERDSVARYCQIEITDLEKIQAYLSMYLIWLSDASE